MKINPDIEKYYGLFKNEPDRLERHPLEKYRTQQLISRYLPPLPSAILDVGGGAGIYAFWLSEMGYQVHLIDPVSYHIEEARRRASGFTGSPCGIAIGDARNLDFPDNSFEMVLMLGPLYHLQEYSDRIAALKEAKRVVKQNGIVISAYISRFASLIDGFFKDLAKQPAWTSIMIEDTTTGRHTNPTGEKGYFTYSYFHHPDEISREIAASGLVPQKVIAVEGFAACVPELDRKIQDPEYRNILLDSISRIEEEKYLLGVSNHILGIGRKP